MRFCAHIAHVLSFAVWFNWALGIAFLNGSEETKPSPDNENAAIERALAEKTEFDFVDLPFGQFIEQLKQRHHIEVQLDEKALADAGVGSDTGIIRRLNGVTLRSALRLALNDLDLTYVIRHQVLLITTKAEAENFEEVRAYPVGDLVRPDTDFVGEPVSRQFSKHAFGGRSDNDYGTLIEVITSAVRPESWDEVARKSHLVFSSISWELKRSRRLDEFLRGALTHGGFFHVPNAD